MSGSLPHPLLVADIGGTNCRVASVTAPGQHPIPVARIATSSTATAEEALRQAIALMPARPRSVVLAVAGPVTGQRAELTNAGWSFDGPGLAHALGIEQGLLVNDFEAVALGLPQLKRSDLLPIGDPDVTDTGMGDATGTRLVLGPGTGFGAAILAGEPGRQLVVPTEAGHMELGPVDAADMALWPHIAPVDGRRTIEAILSGSGLARLDAALRASGGDGRTHDDGSGVQSAALRGDQLALQAIRLFGNLLARVAGDLALACKATGGVFIAGGITPKLMPLFDLPAMRAAFEAKAPMEHLMRRMPLAVITAPDAAERGLAAVALDPAGYGMAGRLWT